MGLADIWRNWRWFAATTFFLLALMLANLRAAPAANLDALARHAFWLLTAGATFCCWWLAHLIVQRGRWTVTGIQLLAAAVLASLLFVIPSFAIDQVFRLPEEEDDILFRSVSEWAMSAVPVTGACMIASLPAWLSVRQPPEAAVGSPSAPIGQAPLLPLAARGPVLKAEADLQYVHLQTADARVTIPGPLQRVIPLLGQGMEIRRGLWVADRHVRQLRSTQGRWICILRDGQRVAVSRRRVGDAKLRYGGVQLEEAEVP